MCSTLCVLPWAPARFAPVAWRESAGEAATAIPSAAAIPMIAILRGHMSFSSRASGRESFSASLRRKSSRRDVGKEALRAERRVTTQLNLALGTIYDFLMFSPKMHRNIRMSARGQPFSKHRLIW
jgi:hypothetical protein